jgi:DmsE family decaheme c-type cytochrome
MQKKLAGESGGPSPSLTKLTANEISNTCLTCHEKANQANFASSMHSRRNVACTACHSVHASKSTKALLKTRTDAEQCFTCHKSERAMSMRTSHHPVREGKMGCVSCHNPHDGSRPKMLQADSVNELCYKCHTEKRGPFLFEHAPVREECVNCHEPHGSNHERLLKAKMPFLCQRCHYSGHGITGDLSNTEAGVPLAPVISGVPAQTTRSAREMERACKQCHLAIHGSNSPSGHFFVR